ncbi:MAG: sensor histidine kinase, partial [Lachnospiraceae bacterium]|nr:sensor histidine kinase [Lachnospiraceae bacterium]
MKPGLFVKDKLLLILLHVVCMGLLSCFLRLTGYGDDKVILILFFWLLVLTAWLVLTYVQRKKYFDETGAILAGMEQKYLLGELLPVSFRLEDKLYQQMLHCSNKSVIERIRKLEDEKREYKEFIESWVHEIKAPITGVALLCENGRKAHDPAPAGTILRDISLENQKIENLVEQVLYYARMEKVYQDFFIKETYLQNVVQEVLQKNHLLLIGKQVRAEVVCPLRVYTDGK